MSSESVSAQSPAVGTHEAPLLKEFGVYGAVLQESFQLAFFLIRDRQMALAIVIEAVRKLRAQCTREQKRSYWRLKFLKRKITRLIRNEEDMLQWLIFLEATRYEKVQESAGRVDMADMIIRYVKHLVQITTAMSSFYVNVGLQRLLYNYRTPEARRSYERLTDLYPNAEAYRAVKAALVGQITNRFGDSLKSCEGERGERRFEAFESQEPWFRLVEKCLNLFVPWSTRGACLGSDFDGISREKLASKKTYRGMSSDTVEAHWCHALLHPPCYEKVTKTAELDEPCQRLALPRFFNVKSSGDDLNNHNRSDEPLSESELVNMVRVFRDDELPWQGSFPKTLRIIADGAECGRIDVGRPGSQFQRELPEGTKLLELRADVGDKDILIGTHWIEYTRWDGVAPVTASLALPDQRELLFEIEPVEMKPGQRSMSIQLRCEPVSTLSLWRDSRKASRIPRFHAFAGFALASATLLVVGWIAATVWYHRSMKAQAAVIGQLQREMTSERQAKQTLQDQLLAEQAVGYLLVPDELRPRGPEASETNLLRISTQASLVVLELPLGIDANLSYRAVLRPFLSTDEILTQGDLVKSMKNREMIVRVHVPSVLLQNDRDYVIDLYSRSVSKAWNKASTFRFRTVKN